MRIYSASKPSSILLNSPSLAYKVREREPTTLSAAFTSAMKLEVLHKSMDLNKVSQRAKFAKGAQLDENFNDFKPLNKKNGPRNIQQSNNGSGPSGAPPRQSRPQKAGDSTSDCRASIKQEPKASLDAESASILRDMTTVLKDVKQEMASLRTQTSTPTRHLASPTPMPTMNSWNHYTPSPTRTSQSYGASPTAHHRPWTIQNSNITPPGPPQRCNTDAARSDTSGGTVLRTAETDRRHGVNNGNRHRHTFVEQLAKIRPRHSTIFESQSAARRTVAYWTPDVRSL